MYTFYMPTTVRVEDDVKADLDRLQGLLQAETGERLSHSELLARLLRVARAHERELFERAARARPTKEEIRRRLGGLAVGGVRVDLSRIDEDLYGGRP